MAKVLAKELTTPRLRLTLIDDTKDDNLEWMAGFFNSAEVRKMMMLPDGGVSVEDCRALLKKYALNPEQSNGYTGSSIYMIRLINSDSDDIIGSASLRCAAQPLPDLGYGFMPPYWGQGYATEAAREMFRYVKEEMGLDKFIAVAALENTGSQHVLKKIGFEYCGIITGERRLALFVLPGMKWDYKLEESA